MFTFKAALQEMAESEIASMVDASRLADIKLHDPRPLIKVFVVGHEGESRGNLIGIGNVVKRWFRTMIHQLHEKVTTGLQLFSGHASGTNDHLGRQQIGEVVGKALRTIDGRESVLVACYVRPDFKHLPLDVASVEIDVAIKPTGDGSVDITGLGELTGIALGNSAVNKPGFPGATLLGQLQAFEEEQRVKCGYPVGLRLGYGSNTNTIRLAKSEED